jgi:hypothetical protein
VVVEDEVGGLLSELLGGVVVEAGVLAGEYAAQAGLGGRPCKLEKFRVTPGMPLEVTASGWWLP